jgi:hypothetical protein
MFPRDSTDAGFAAVTAFALVTDFGFAACFSLGRVRFGDEAGFLDLAFLADVFADFFEVFFAAGFFTAFFDFLAEGRLFFERFFVAALAAPCLFLAFFFFEGVFLGATANSFKRQINFRSCLSAERLLRGFRKQPEHRENQRFSFKIVF